MTFRAFLFSGDDKGDIISYQWISRVHSGGSSTATANTPLCAGAAVLESVYFYQYSFPGVIVTNNDGVAFKKNGLSWSVSI
ncbi:MAG TPA: hypothetical protein VEV83_05775 [Parafilimonas sp.]|nr:hypothetical protein [Parafilimonas sp.]